MCCTDNVIISACLTIFALAAQGAGTLRFRGATSFAEGEWVGVELDEASASA